MLDLLAVGSRIYLQEPISYGTPVVHICSSPAERYSVVFEDDGDTGYFYARDGEAIVDAMQIYLASAQTGPATLQIAWADDGLKAVAVIDRTPQAIFDFAACRGYCRRNF
ncbi:MAG: hypothetical protein DME77_07090, partial [Verrucomicrobia bacterium]